MKLAHLLSNCSLNCMALYVNLDYLELSLAILKVHTRERKKYISLMYIVYVDSSNNTPYYSHISSYMVGKSPSPPMKTVIWILVHNTYCWRWCMKL